MPYTTNLIRLVICTCLLASPQLLASVSTNLSREGDISPRDVHLYQQADGTVNIVIGRLSLRVDSAMRTRADLVTDSGLVSLMVDDRIPSIVSLRCCDSRFTAVLQDMKIPTMLNDSLLTPLMIRITKKLDFRRGHWLRYVKETIIGC